MHAMALAPPRRCHRAATVAAVPPLGGVRAVPPHDHHRCAPLPHTACLAAAVMLVPLRSGEQSQAPLQPMLLLLRMGMLLLRMGMLRLLGPADAQN